MSLLTSGHEVGNPYRRGRVGWALALRSIAEGACHVGGAMGGWAGSQTVLPVTRENHDERSPAHQAEIETPSPDRYVVGFPSLIAQLFSGLQTAVEPNRVEFSLRGYLGGLPRRRFVRLVGRDHDAVVRRLGADEPESGECTAVGEEAAP